MNNEGYATYTVDRLGTGKSSRSLLISVSLQATAVHSVIQELKDGVIGNLDFGKVIIMSSFYLFLFFHLLVFIDCAWRTR